MIFEHHTEQLLPRRQFLNRLALHGGIGGAAVLVSLAIGMVGFHALAREGWLDSFLNATMLLGGMGLVGTIEEPAGKVFAGVYALYAGIIFLGASALILAPILHRVLHKLRLDE